MRQRSQTAEERLEKLLALQAILARVSHEIGPALELRPVLTTVLAAMRSVVDFRGGTICLVESGHISIAAADPDVSPDVAAFRLPVGSGLAGKVVSTRRPMYSPDLDADPRVDPALRGLGSNAGMRSYLAVPLACLGEVIGLIQVDSPHVDAFDLDDLNVLSGLAAQVAGAVESARRREAAAELEQQKSDFIARVSHELRTPLTVLAGFTTTLQAHWPDMDETQRARAFTAMRSASDRLLGLIDELLTAAQLEAGVSRPEPEELDVATVLDKARAVAPTPDRVTVDCRPGLVVWADGRLLQHALALLIDNALKYGGSAELSAELDPATGRCRIDVTDHGPGVAPNLRSRVFERFTRGDHPVPGLGLGLPLVTTLAAGLDASVELVDPPDGGACFRLRFR